MAHIEPDLCAAGALSVIHGQERPRLTPRPRTHSGTESRGVPGGGGTSPPGRDRSVVEPAAQRGAADEGDLAVGVDPVAHAELADEAERIARAGAVAVGGQ